MAENQASNLDLVTDLLLKLVVKAKNSKRFEQPSGDYLSQEIRHLFSHNLRYPTYIQQGCFFNQEVAKIFQAYSFNSQKYAHAVKNKRFFSS